MSDAATPRQVTPFESASELRDAHARLLETLDEALGRDASAEGEAAALARIEPRILEFLRRGEATGIFLEEIKERTACQTLLDYWVSSLSQAGRPAGTVRLARFDGSQLPDLEDKPCPYVGLDAFRDRTFFFGREVDTQALLEQVQKAPLVVVLGASGSGKSSLVIGGLLPALAGDKQLAGLCVVPPFVPGNRALAHLARAVRESSCGAGGGGAADDAAFRQDPGRLSAVLGAAAGQAALVAIDQFEEVFTLLDEAEREALVANLAALLAAGRGHRVILTVREEFRSRIVGLSALSPYLDTAWYSMRPMGYAELRAAVEKPAALVNLQFQSGIVDDLVKKVLGQPAALPLLQFTLHELWEKRDRNRITFEVYRKVGDPLTALTASADQFYDGLALQTQDEVKRILLELVRVDELLEAYRQPVAKSQLLKPGRANTESVLGLLAANDYVRIAPSAGDPDAVVEVKHESLVRNWPRFVAWIDEKRHQRRERLALAQAAERWAQGGKPADGLLTGWQLEVAESTTELQELEKEFVQASREAIDRERHEKEEALRREAQESRATAHRFLAFWIATGVLAAIAIVAIYSALKLEGSRAEMKAEAQFEAMTAEATNREKVLLAMKALNYVDDQLDVALLLGIEVNRLLAREAETQRALLVSLIANLELASLFAGHTDDVRAVAFSPDGKTIASGSFDNTVILWNPQGRMLHPPLKGHEDGVMRVAFSPDGKLLASASTDGTVRLWDVESGRPVARLDHPEEVYSVAIDRRGKILAASGKGGRIRLWNIESIDKRRVETTLVHNEDMVGLPAGSVFTIAFSPDSRTLATGGLDGRIVLWDLGKRRKVDALVHVGQGVWSLAFSHDGKTVAAGTAGGQIHLWDVAQRKRAATLRTSHGSGVMDIAFSPDDRQIATVGHDRNAYIHDAARVEAPARRLNGYADAFLSVDFARDGNVVTGTSSAMVVSWNLRGHHRFGNQLAPPGRNFTRVAYGGSPHTLFSFSRDVLHYWDLDVTGTPEPQAVEAKQGRIEFVMVSPDGRWLVTIGTDYGVKLWDAAARREIRVLRAPGKERVLSAAFSKDGRTLALGVGGAIQLQSVPEGNVIKTLPRLWTGNVTALAFNPGGQTLASAIDGIGIAIWDLATGAPLVTPLSGSEGARLDHRYVNSLAYTPDGRVLVSGGRESVGFWNSGSGRPMGRVLGYHPGAVRTVAVSPDGKLLASGSSDRTVLLWDVARLQPLSKPIAAHAAGVLSVDFSPDGQWLVSSGDDGQIIRWELDTQAWLSGACGVVGRNFTELEWRQFFGDQPYRVSCPSVRAGEADAAALAGDRVLAERLFAQAVSAVREARDHRASNTVCWLGSANRYAQLVLPACEQAVELAPDARRRALYGDSRGLARALTGDIAGATKDFSAAVEHMKHDSGFGPEYWKLREAWIAALKDGRDPFDDAMLKSLRFE